MSTPGSGKKSSQGKASPQGDQESSFSMNFSLKPIAVQVDKTALQRLVESNTQPSFVITSIKEEP